MIENENSEEINEVTNVVLAEDDEDDVLIFKMAINKLSQSIKLKIVEDGEKLIALLTRFVPDMLFLDIQMPCRDGLSCISAIRKDPRFDRLPIILVSGFEHRDYIENGFNSGANFYVVKTGTLDKMIENLKKVFSINWKEEFYTPSKADFVLGN